MKDQYGRCIYIGDIITYPTRKGSKVYVNTAVVLNISEQHLCIQRYDVNKYTKGRYTTLQNVHLCTVVTDVVSDKIKHIIFGGCYE
jgi:hypothetical protein